MCAIARSMCARAVLPKPCVCRPPRKAASAARELAEQCLPLRFNDFDVVGVHQRGMVVNRGTMTISETHGSPIISVPRNFSAWTRLTRPCISGSSICSSRQPNRKARRVWKTKTSMSVGDVFLPSDSGLLPRTKNSNCRMGIPQRRRAVTNSMNVGSGGMSSTQPVKCGLSDVRPA